MIDIQIRLQNNDAEQSTAWETAAELGPANVNSIVVNSPKPRFVGPNFLTTEAPLLPSKVFDAAEPTAEKQPNSPPFYGLFQHRGPTTDRDVLWEPPLKNSDFDSYAEHMRNYAEIPKPTAESPSYAGHIANYADIPKANTEGPSYAEHITNYAKSRKPTAESPSYAEHLRNYAEIRQKQFELKDAVGKKVIGF